MGQPPNPALLIGLQLTPVSSICFCLQRATAYSRARAGKTNRFTRKSRKFTQRSSPAVCWCLLVKGIAGEASGTLQMGGGGTCRELSGVSLQTGTAHVWSFCHWDCQESQSEHKGLTTRADMSFTTEERGRPNTAEHRVFFSKSASLTGTTRVSPHCWIHNCAEKVDCWLSTEDSAGKHISPFHDIPIYASEEEVSPFQQFLCVYVHISHQLFSASPFPLMVRFFS